MNTHKNYVSRDLNVTESDLAEAKELASRLTLEEVRPMMEKVLLIHENDPNFPFSIIIRIKAFLGERGTLLLKTGISKLIGCFIRKRGDL